MSEETPVVDDTEKPTVVTFNLNDEKQAKHIKDALTQLLDFYTEPKYRYLNKEFLDKINMLPIQQQIHELRMELSNAVLSFHFVHAAKMEADRQLSGKK